MAHSPRGWTGARTPSALKRVRQTERRRAVNQPRRTAAKTLISKALVSATDAAGNGGTNEEVRDAVERAVSALDRAAKLGVIHKNAADRRKSRLMLKVNATLGGDGLVAPTKGGAKVARTTSKAAAAKQAKARIAASRATKAKGAQTAAGKARAALARTTRDTSGEKSTPAPAEPKTTSRPAASAKASGKSSAKGSSTKSSSKTPAKSASKSASTAKGSTSKATKKS